MCLPIAAEIFKSSENCKIFVSNQSAKFEDIKSTMRILHKLEMKAFSHLSMTGSLVLTIIVMTREISHHFYENCLPQSECPCGIPYMQGR